MSEATLKKNMGRAPQVREINFQLEQQVFQRWAFTAPHGSKFEDLLEPNFWASVAHKVQPWDVIVVKSEDHSFWGELLVLHKEKFSLQVGKLRYVELDKLESKIAAEELELSADKYNIEFDAKNKWKCIRKSDRVQIFQGHLDKKSAENALEEYLKRLGA